jgi:hypothetical protein
MSGIAYDNGNYWVAQYYPDPSQIFKVSAAGTVLRQFQAPNNQPWDVCMQGRDLWIADYWGNSLYKVDTLGTVLDSHASLGIDPAGIVWDGNYLWYCDDGASNTYDRLYKVDLSGSGTPVIYLPANNFNFSNVVLNSSSTWNCVVVNNGTANLVINNVTMSGSPSIICNADYPITILPGAQTTIPFVFSPVTFGPATASASIASNDPVHPATAVTLTGYGVYSGPDISVIDSSYSYGNVRVNAYTRYFLRIVNKGSLNLSVNSITPSDGHFTVELGLELPIYVAPLDTAVIGIWFRPLASQTYIATLSIASNDPDENPFLAEVRGVGIKEDHPIGDTLWSYLINDGFDNSPKAMAPIGDLNGDGIPDLIVCSEDYKVRAMNGNANNLGDVLWEHEIPAGSIYQQTALAIHPDVNGDGFEEVVVGAAWGGCLIRMLNGKTGGEIWTHDTHNYGSGGWVYAVDCHYDYNGDGVLDVLAATGDDGNGTGPKRVYCLNGNTGVPLWECPLNGAVFSVIGIEDFTGDGKPDVVAGASNAGETAGFAYGINGLNGAVVWTMPVPGSSVWALAQLDDINGDGTKDIAVGDFSQTTGSVFGVNAKTGAILWTRSAGFGSILRLQVMDDLNGDGHRDLVPGHWGLFAAAIDGQTGQLIWTHPLADKSWNIARGNDVNGDGINDVFVGTLYQSNFCYFLSGTDGSEIKSVAIDQPIDALTAIPDIVGDNSWELVAGGREGNIYCLSGGINSVANHAPNTPGSPVPADQATGISLTPTLSWTGGDPDVGDIVNYDVYFGATSSPGLVSTGQAATSYIPAGPLTSGTVHYWRIVAHDAHGNSTPGALWRFTTGGSYVCGDANGDHSVDISDAVSLIAYIFSGGPAPNPLQAGDGNCDTVVDISDAVYVIAYIFSGGPAPCATCK